MKVEFKKAQTPTSGALLMGWQDKTQPFLANELETALGESKDSLFSRSLSENTTNGGDSTSGKSRRKSLNLATPKGFGPQVLTLTEFKRPSKAFDWQKLGESLFKVYESGGHKQLCVDVGPLSAVELADLAFGALLKSYRFSKYLGEEKPETRLSVERLVFFSDNPQEAEESWKEKQALAEGVFAARDLVNEPGNKLHPENYADFCQALNIPGLEVDVLDEKKLENLGFGSLLSVSHGSARPARVVTFKWNGGEEGEAPLVLVGKGVTFDTGGISLKPGRGMHQMKMDMAGSAAVVGAMMAFAKRQAKANVFGIIGLVENMPSSSATRPGDIVTSLSGQTVEILNTDAEGRLVLADLLWYAKENWKPREMINLATLTGAILMALGYEYAGLFSNSDDLAEGLTNAGKESGELCWRLPLGAAYNKLLDSPVADMQNISGARSAGSITAACFLERFVGEVPWAHLDIAGTGMLERSRSLAPKGGSGYGVRLLDSYLRKHYEK